MMKGLYLYLFFAVLVTATDGKGNTKQEILSISSGTSFGMCAGYCRQSIKITSNPRELIALKEPNFDQAEYPLVQKQFPFSLNQWQQLINLVDSKGFQALDDTIGCPDCADGGAEWIEIVFLNTAKRVTFEYGHLIKGFEGLINQLRKLRDDYVSKL